MARSPACRAGFENTDRLKAARLWNRIHRAGLFPAGQAFERSVLPKPMPFITVVLSISRPEKSRALAKLRSGCFAASLLFMLKSTLPVTSFLAAHPCGLSPVGRVGIPQVSNVITPILRGARRVGGKKIPLNSAKSRIFGFSTATVPHGGTAAFCRVRFLYYSAVSLPSSNEQREWL